MIDKKKIKIVKRTEGSAVKSSKRKPARSKNAAREMVATVTEWVSDLKHRKSEETKAAFDLLFAANRRANES